MANGDDPIVFPQLQDPAVLAAKIKAKVGTAKPQAQAQSTPAAAGPYAKVYELLRGIEDPLQKDIVRLSYQDMFQDLTNDQTLRIPSEEDYLIQQQEKANQFQKLRIEGAKLKIHEANAALEGASSDVQARLRFRPGLLEENPTAWLASVEAAGGGVSMEDLQLAAEAPEITLDTAKLGERLGKKQSEALGQQVTNTRNREAQGQAVADTLLGKTQASQDVGEITKGVEQMFGALSPSNLDEAGGSKGLVVLRKRMNKALGETLGSKGVAALIGQKYGPAIADQMEEVPLNDKGEIDPSQGNTGILGGITKDASYFLSTLAVGVAKDRGVSVGQVVQEWGVPAKGIDFLGWLDETQRRADAEGKSVIDVFKDEGLEGMENDILYIDKETGEPLLVGDYLAQRKGK